MCAFLENVFIEGSSGSVLDSPAGTPNSQALTIQGNASGVPVPVTGTFSAPTGTQTVVVAGTSTVEVAGIAGGTVALAGTSTVTVAGGTVDVAGTSTVSVAGIVQVAPTTSANTRLNPFFNEITDGANVMGSMVAFGATVSTSTATPVYALNANVAVQQGTVAVVGTSTISIVGTSTVTVAGGTVDIAGTSTVVVSGGTIDIAGTSTNVIVGTSTVTIAGNITIAETPTVAISGTSTVVVSGGTVDIAGTSTVVVSGGTVDVAGTSTVTVVGTVTVAATGTQTVTIAGNVTLAETPTVAISGTSTVIVSGGTVDIAGTSTVTVAGTVTAACTGTQTVTVVGTSTVEVAGIIGTSTVAIVGVSTVNIQGHAGATLDSTVVPGTAPTNGLAVLGQYNTTLPTCTASQTVALQVNAQGELIVQASVAAPTGTQTVTVVGTSTVEVAGIVGTPTVEVAGILGTSTVTVAGTVTVAATGTQTVTVVGTSTVQVAGGTVDVAGTSTNVITGIVQVAPTAAANTRTNPFFNEITDGTNVMGTMVAFGSNPGTALALNANASIIGTPSVAIAGTSTVEVAGIIGTSTVVIAGTSTTIVNGVYNTTQPTPVAGAEIPLQQDQAANLLVFPGIQLETGATWNSSTAVNTVQYPTGTSVVGAPVGSPMIAVYFQTTGTFSTGQVTFEYSLNGTTWQTIAGAASEDTAVVLSGVAGAAYAPITSPVSFSSVNSGLYYIQLNGAPFIRIRLSGNISGTGTVTPYWESLPHVIDMAPTAFGTYPNGTVARPVNASMFAGSTALSATSGSLNVTGAVSVSGTQTISVVGTSTVQVAGISSGTVQVAGTSTVEVSGIVGTSTVTVAGNVSIAGTSTVEVAGIVGTSTVAIAGTSTVQVAGISAGTVAVAGTSTVEVAGIVGTSTVTVAGVTGVVTAASAPASGLAVLTVNNTTPPSLTTGQSVAVQSDYEGSLFVKPIRRSQTTSKATTISLSAAATTVLAAQAAGIFADISNLMITPTPIAGATAGITFTATLSDGTNSYIFDMNTGNDSTTTIAGNPGDPINLHFNPPLPATSAATAWTIALSVATVTVHITATAVLQKAS